ncbi:hypothetical protein [Lewinella sp. IMCC34183]|uniref:hypothetical protein n=1 Tax=Lewinella sp. IMCC34183 TaxID=2248762 RepID=UPI000E24FE87|nr:hypothetical protein [Lewinella sp. IMCC34183]
MFKKQHITSPEARLPEVAEAASKENCSDTLTDLAALKVFLKRNLRHEEPPVDLLADIRARIADLREEA